MPDTFHTITAEDWRRSLRDARSQPNVVMQEIQQAKAKLHSKGSNRAFDDGVAAKLDPKEQKPC